MTTALRPDLTDGVVRLRPPKPSDVQARIKLGNTPEIHKMFGADPDQVVKITKAHAEKWYNAQAFEPLAWVIEHKRRMIGAVRLHTVHHWDARASFAIGILDPKLLGKGIGTRATHLMAAHAFGPLALHRLSVRIIDFNARAIASFAKVGFVQEGRERQSARVGGTRHDEIVMGLLSADYTAPVYAPAKKRQPAQSKARP